MKIIVFKLLLILLLFTRCNNIYESIYQNPPLNIDGSSSDWTTTLDSKGNSGLSYSISNDQNNLYIRLNTSDQSIQRKIQMAGFTIWIDTTGKKKKNLGITCPINKIPGNMDRNAMRQIQKKTKWDKNQLLEAEFIGFNNNPEHFYISKNPYNVEISINQDKFKSLYYEMKVPFSALKVEYSNLLLKSLSIGLETGALERPSSPTTSGRPGGMPGKSMGGNRPGGMPTGGGPRGAPNQSELQELSTPTKLWIKNIKLAQP